MVKKRAEQHLILCPARDQARHNEHRKQTCWPMRDECNDPSAEKYKYATANARHYRHLCKYFNGKHLQRVDDA